jgi:hypothetical protein
MTASARSHLVGRLLDPGAFEAADPPLVEHRVHGHDALELGGDGGEVALLEHPGGAGGLEGVGRDRVPPSEHQVVEVGEWDELLDERVATLGSVAEADPGHLGHRADRVDPLLAGVEDTGDEGGGHGAEAGGEDAERPVAGAMSRGSGMTHQIRVLLSSNATSVQDH